MSAPNPTQIQISNFLVVVDNGQGIQTVIGLVIEEVFAMHARLAPQLDEAAVNKTNATNKWRRHSNFSGYLPLLFSIWPLYLVVRQLLYGSKDPSRIQVYTTLCSYRQTRV